MIQDKDIDAIRASCNKKLRQKMTRHDVVDMLRALVDAGFEVRAFGGGGVQPPGGNGDGGGG